MNREAKQARRLGRRTLEIYKELDGPVERIAEKQNATCKRGCHSCCYMFVTTSLPEGVAIAEYVAKEWSPNRLQALMKKLYAEARYLAKDEFSEDEHFVSKRPCVFLDTKNGDCTIYPVRPAVCRYHYVVSDPEKCNPDNGKQRVKMIDFRDLEGRVRSEGDRVSKQVGAPFPTMAPIPVTVLWGKLLLEHGVPHFRERVSRLGRVFDVAYWPARMVRMALMQGLYEIYCPNCDYHKVMGDGDIAEDQGTCPECDAAVKIRKTPKTLEAIKEETAS